MAAESSPALVSESVAGLSGDERLHWQLTGELPADRTPASDSSTDPPEVQAEEIASERPADSEPAPSSKPRGTAATRVKEIDADIVELRAKLAERAKLREEVARTAPVNGSASDVKPAASSPASETPPAELLSRPDISRPALEEGDFFTLYPKATLGQFTRYQTRYELLRDQAERTRTTAIQTGQQRYDSHLDAVREADPEIDAKLPKAFIDASPVITQGSGPMNFVKREIQDSEVGAQLLQYLGDHPEEFTRLERAPDAATVIRIMARLEARVSPSPSPSPTPQRGISLAPKPTTTLGRKNASPANAALAAVADGNVRGYMDEANREAIARKRAR